MTATLMLKAKTSLFFFISGACALTAGIALLCLVGGILCTGAVLGLLEAVGTRLSAATLPKT